MDKLITWLVRVLIVATVVAGIYTAIRYWGLKPGHTDGFEPGLPTP